MDIKYDTRQFENDLQELGLRLTDEQIGQFLTYYEMLTEWNQVMNLTAITEYGDVMKKHFIDSLSLVKAVSLKGEQSLIDVGTGAGFPGLALKIAFPGLNVTLLDSLRKRIDFLNAVVQKLHLDGVEMIHGRAEDLARTGDLEKAKGLARTKDIVRPKDLAQAGDLIQAKKQTRTPDQIRAKDLIQAQSLTRTAGKREKYDICVSRAVANLSTLSEYCIPFVKVGGVFVSYKSEKLSEELKQAQHAISVLGAVLEKQVEFTLPDSDIYRNLLVIKKLQHTPGKYPRQAGQPQKNPIF